MNELTMNEYESQLFAAEAAALRLLDRIEALKLIQPGRTERDVETDIRKLAKDEFGVVKHWHKRIVRAGWNTMATASDDQPLRTIDDDDMVFVDLGPVFGEWEADVARTFVVGGDPRKHALCNELLVQFDLVAEYFNSKVNITGQELYAFACDSARSSGWEFGGKIAGHIIDRFPHANPTGANLINYIARGNTERLRNLNVLGRVRYWILEIHLIDPGRKFGGFYERLMPSMLS